jgi:hypothetical protein
MLSGVRSPVGAENPIPEEADHCEVAVRVPVMNKVQFLPASESFKLLKPRSLYVIFFVEKDVGIGQYRISLRGTIEL